MFSWYLSVLLIGVEEACRRVRQVVVLAVVVATAVVGPDLWVHMLALVLVCKLLVDLLQQHILVQVLWTMHLLLPTPIWTHKLLHVEPISTHILKLVLVEVLHGDSILHKLTLGSHWAVMHKALNSLVP